MNAMLPITAPEVAIPAAIVLGAARALGLLSIFPLFSLFSVLGILRIGLAIGLSAPAVSHTYGMLLSGNTGWLELAALSIKEFALGGLIGLGLGIPFWAAQTAGDITDVYRGANAANLFDQVNALETTPLGSILIVIALAIFVVSGGLVDLIAIFYRSFELWPVLALTPGLEADMLVIVAEIFATLFRTGVLVAAPFVVVMGAVELSLGFIGRSARQFPLNDNVTAFKNLAVAAVLVVYALFAASYFNKIWVKGFGEVKAVLDSGIEGRDGGQ